MSGRTASVSMGDSRDLFDWIQYYTSVICLIVVIGAGGGVAYSLFVPRVHESSSLIMNTSGPINARQLGLVSEAMFRSPVVYGPAMEKLGIDQPAQEFLSKRVDLRPIPDTDTLLVVGRSQDLQQARQLSTVMAQSLVEAVNERPDIGDFIVFGETRAGAARQGIAPSVAVGLGGTIGFWLGLAGAVLHYRWRRPVLTLSHAVSVVGTDKAIVADGKWWRWVGFFRPNPRRLDVIQSETRRQGMTTGARKAAFNTEGALQSGYEPMVDSDEVSPILVHAGTSERDLQLMRLVHRGANAGSGARQLELIWVR